MRIRRAPSAHRRSGHGLTAYWPPHLPRLGAALHLLAFLCLIPTAPAQTTINVPSGQPTIQAGINAANNGDTVLVAPGTYYENIDFLGKAITVTSSAGPSTTILDGSIGQIPAVSFHNKEGLTSVLNGFTIQGGGFEGYPVPITTFSQAGIWISQGSPTISNNVITHNHCYSIESQGSSPLIQNNEIDNTLDAQGHCSFAGGAAIWLFGSLNNYNGGTQSSTPPAMVIGNTIQNNTQSGKEDAGGNGGPGVAIWGAYASVIGNTIRNNLTLGDGGAILAFNTDNVVVIGNLIYGNRAATDGAISLSPPDATVGPFIGIVASNTIYGNTQTTSKGGALGDVPPAEVYLSGNLGQYVLVNNIIVGPGAGSVAVACGTIYSYLSLTPLVFDHNDIYNPGGAAYGGSCPDQTGTFGNISADPQFANPPSNNFQLTAGSPAVDSGNNSAPLLPSTDLAGSPRIQDATGKGYPMVDMGVYEFPGQKDANPTVLTLTPSEYFFPPNFYYPNPTQPLTFTVTLASAIGTPTGPVNISVDGAVATTVLVGSSGVAAFSLSTLTPGLHAFIATYDGSGSFPPAVSVKFYLIIPPYVTTLTLKSSSNPSTLGSPVTFSITVSAADNSIPSPITLVDSATNTLLATLTPNSSGVATFTTSTLSVGVHFVQAAYAGNTTYAAASAYLQQYVTNGIATSVGVASSQNPASYGQTVTFTAAVTNIPTAGGSPSGSISFTDGSTLLATQPLTSTGPNASGASFSSNGLSVGSHSITATYIPASGFAGGSAALTQTITGINTTTALASASNPISYGQSVTFTATVSNTSAAGSPTGSVTFSDGATLLTTQPLTAASGSAAAASFSTSTLSAGVHRITADYVPTGGFGPSNASLTETILGLVTSTALTAAPNPALVGQTVTLKAAVTGFAANPTGSITFYDGANPLGVMPLDTSGHAAVSTTVLAIGTHTLAAVYAGNTIYSASTSPAVIETIQPLPQDFTLTLASPTVTIKTQHHLTTTLILTSLGGFADRLALTCANLPQYVTCSPTPNPAPLTANGISTVSLYLDTDSVLGYACNRPAPPPGDTHASPFNLALSLSPISFFTGLAAFSRRRTRIRLLLLLFSLIPASFALGGCGEIIYPYDVPPSAAPGTYTIPITATGAATGITHTANLTLTVTP